MSLFNQINFLKYHAKIEIMSDTLVHGDSDNFEGSPYIDLSNGAIDKLYDNSRNNDF